MKTYQGKTICEGFAAGKPLIYQRTITEPVRLQITDVKEQLERLNKAKLTAMDQLNLLREKALTTLGKDQAMIFESHIAILEDPEFHQSITLRIESESINAEYAVLEASREYADFFDSMGDPFLAERGSDVEDVARRLIACLASDQNTQVTPLEFESGKKYILCAEELTPSEALSLRPDAVLAILLAYGSPTTHASILAKSKNIPAIIGLGPEFLTDLSEDTLLLVNASDGAVIIEPTEQ
ncbi:MAG: hypothetical protein J6Z22_04790, partial [Lachnospiraceae bacterium]|nr:hypothetical protein [Lachnospiraceae bacterium]